MEPETTISLIALFISGTSIFWNFRTDKMSKQNSKRDTLVICLQKYMDIMKSKSEAINKDNENLAKNYYRELLDLYWMEFELYQINLIEKDTYENWLLSRNKEYKEERFLKETGVFKEKNINYKNQWDKLKNDYFNADDPFIEHMDLTHEGNIDKALEMVRKKK